MTILKHLALILTVAALSCTTMVAITKAPAKTDNHYFVLNCSDDKKIPHVQYQVLAQSTVLKKVADHPQLKNKIIFLPNIDHLTMTILLTYMTIVCNELKKDDLIKTIQTIQKTFIDDKCINSFLDDDNQTVLNVYYAADFLGCTLIRNALAPIISEIFHSQTLPIAPLDNASDPKQCEDTVAIPDEFVQYFEQSNGQYASFTHNDLINFTYDPQASPLQDNGESLSSKDNLTITTQRVTAEKPFKCTFPDCEKAFVRKDNLTQHIIIHTGEKPFQCTFSNCGKAFSQSCHLIKHLKTHTGEKPFRCTFDGCDKGFIQKSNLTKHIRTHTGEKPFKCTFPDCNKAFAQSNTLTKHINTHVGEKHFHCTIDDCSKSYTDRSNLIKHIKTHTGEKAFKCTFSDCDKAFADKSDLTKHIRTHTGEKPFKCTFDDCNKAFAQTGGLTRHIRTHKK